jgi:hypothetical protein
VKEIYLSQGKVAIVDDDRYDEISKFKWYVVFERKKFYAVRHSGKSRIWMHRYILQTPLGRETDHINGDTLDNRCENLRICTRSQNMANQRKTRGSSKYKGVYWYKPRRKWKAELTFNQEHIYLGLFESEIDAAKAYDDKAKEIFGEFAHLNF